jgi:NADH-quinone oxidoreductase subunit L
MASSVSAIIRQDLKKVVALSTLRQLRLIFVTLSLGLKRLALFHLLSHAGFKRGLFIAVGVILHSSLGSQRARIKIFVNST